MSDLYIYSNGDKEIEYARKRGQGTDELIVETGISTFPCQCAPCHNTELENKEGERKEALIGQHGETPDFGLKEIQRISLNIQWKFLKHKKKELTYL